MSAQTEPWARCYIVRRVVERDCDVGVQCSEDYRDPSLSLGISEVGRLAHSTVMRKRSRRRRSERARSTMAETISAYDRPDFFAAIKNSELLESHGLGLASIT